jgi:outer membrane protein TolC
VEADVRLALATLRAARKTLGIAEDAVLAAQKNVDETEALYRQGLAKAIELTEANLTRFDAEVTRESARVQMHLAYLDVRQALGFDPIGDQG